MSAVPAIVLLCSLLCLQLVSYRLIQAFNWTISLPEKLFLFNLIGHVCHIPFQAYRLVHIVVTFT